MRKQNQAGGDTAQNTDFAQTSHKLNDYDKNSRGTPSKKCPFDTYLCTKKLGFGLLSLQQERLCEKKSPESCSTVIKFKAQ